LSQLLSKVTVTSCSFYIRCSMYPPCCWTTHSSRRRRWPMARSVASPAWYRPTQILSTVFFWKPIFHIFHKVA